MSNIVHKIIHVERDRDRDRDIERAIAMKFEILRMKYLCGHMDIEVEALRKIPVFS